jgi:hypothetical protein
MSIKALYRLAHRAQAFAVRVWRQWKLIFVLLKLLPRFKVERGRTVFRAVASATVRVFQ